MNETDWTPATRVEWETVAARQRLIRHDWIALTTGPFLVYGLFGLGLWFGFYFFQFGYWAVPVSIAIAAAGAWAAVLIDRRRKALALAMADADRILREEFGGGTGYFVDVIILQGAAPTGRDQGVLWIEDRRLYFSGHRSSFALSPDQVDGACRRVASVRGVRHSLELPLRHTTGIGPVTLSISPRESLGKGSRWPDVPIDRWATLPAKDEGQFPPTTLGPGAASRLRVFMGALTNSAFWPLILLAALRATNPGAFALVLLAAVLGSSVFDFWHPRARWRAWRDLGRLP